MSVAPGEVALSYHNQAGVALGLLTARTLSQTPWDFRGQVNASGTSGEVVVALGEDSEAAPHFFRLVDLQTDSDGDRLPDLLETYVYKTDPHNADTSGSGMSDWEKIFVHGLDPMVSDSDQDGLLDGEEVTFETSPFRADTDGDGLTDTEECAPMLVRHGASARWFESEGWTELYPAGSPNACDTQAFTLSGWGFPIVFGGTAYTELVVDVNGRLILRDPGSDERIASQGYNRLLTDAWLYERHALIAGYWDDLLASVAHGSRIRYTTAHEGNDDYLVVEYLKMRSASHRTDANGQLSFQIALRKVREGERVSHVLFNYWDVGEGVRGGSATIGVQCQGRKQVWQYAHNASAAIDSGMSLLCVPGMRTHPSLRDGDGDGLTDPEEYFGARYLTDPNRFDTDGDGLGDGEEVKGVWIGGNHRYMLDPLRPDCDSDGLPDGWEARYGLNPLNAAGVHGAEGDGDNDGLTNFNEYRLGTKPNVADTDGDGFSDGLEVRYGLPPLDNGATLPAACPEGDWDGDGISNRQELELGLHPGKADSDEDGLPDGDELALGTNPLHIDSDGDHLNDGWEVAYGFPPLVADGPEVTEADPDQDGLSNWEESTHGTNPYSADTDGDGVPDKREAEQGTNPLDPEDKAPLAASRVVPETSQFMATMPRGNCGSGAWARASAPTSGC